ncbi:cation diffusion facilitator family transporter [Azotosporobacter soli]|uniref:cation diffusion facilitator family transporter n=1 Tax=Azotosporobacter soli TaxID=3055040 RepID=UPI0031FF1CBE
MHHHEDRRSSGNQSGLLIAALITGGIMFVEFFGGLATNSLALLSDAGHMLSDLLSLALSLFAVWFAAKPPSARNLFGYQRSEILTALFNGLALFIIAVLIGKEAYVRFLEPQAVASEMMMLIAAIGLAANLVSAAVLLRRGDAKNNINVRSAYLHIVGDALGSVGAIVAGLLMYYYQWYLADPIISVIVALIILKGAWRVIKESLHILMEGVPLHLDAKEIENRIATIDGVVAVHELRIWTLTSGVDSLACHLLIEPGEDGQTILRQARTLIKESFQIRYQAIQIETQDCR